MSITRSEAELQSAIETMFRVRAVESPPDDQGARTIWHRGSKGADLVTWVDAFGRVTRQELYLFEDCLVWEKASGVRTGESEPHEGSKLNPAPGSIAYDPANDDQRLFRARKALSPYSGADKFILHARKLLAGEELAHDPVTRTSGNFLEDAIKARVAQQEQAEALAKANRAKWIGIAGGLLLLGAALISMLMRAG